jgi:hypothetical protein
LENNSAITRLDLKRDSNRITLSQSLDTSEVDEANLRNRLRRVVLLDVHLSDFILIESRLVE